MKILYFLALVIKLSSSLYTRNDNVIELTPNNFDSKVLNSDGIWMIEFYAPWCGHCKQLVPEYTKFAKATKGIINVGVVNADEHKTLAQRYGVQGFPTLKIFGVNKKSPTDYNDQRTANNMVDAVLAEAKRMIKGNLNGGNDYSDKGSGSKDVIELTDSNFDKLVLDSDDVWLVEFYAPWCGHCKALAPEWSKAASELRGKVKLGALDATVHTVKAQEYGIKGYPSIKIFHAGKKRSSDAEDYNGGRTASDIVAYALEKYSTTMPPPEILEVIDKEMFTQNCDTKSLCIVSVLPHILDCNAECRNSYLDILKHIGDKYKAKQWGWIWSEAGAQQQLEQILDIGGFGYPAMAAVNFKKMKYSLMKGSFSKEGINEFLRDISYGRGQTAPLRGNDKPEIVKADPWDGKDGELPPEEDIDYDKDEL